MPFMKYHFMYKTRVIKLKNNTFPIRSAPKRHLHRKEQQRSRHQPHLLKTCYQWHLKRLRFFPRHVECSGSHWRHLPWSWTLQISMTVHSTYQLSPYIVGTTHRFRQNISKFAFLIIRCTANIMVQWSLGLVLRESANIICIHTGLKRLDMVVARTQWFVYTLDIQALVDKRFIMPARVSRVFVPIGLNAPLRLSTFWN